MISNIKLITNFLLIASVVNATHGCLNDDIECQSGSFCGSDNLCHEYSCTNFFTFGPEQYKGYAEGAIPPELVCNPFVSSDEDDYIYNGVGYGCMIYPNSKPDSNFAVTMPFNEKCSVEIDMNTRFDCYKYAADTNFDVFLLSVNNSDVCSEEIRKDYADSTYDLGPPAYLYSDIFEYQYSTETSGNLEGPNATQVFDENLALSNTMYSILSITDIDTKSPTDSPSTESPTDSPHSSGSSSNYDRVNIQYIHKLLFPFAALACGFLP